MSPPPGAWKRVFDLVTAGGALLLLSPLLLALSAVIAIKLGRPILFRQERTGFGRKPFHIIKFRSMLDAVDEDGRVLPDEERLTPFGRKLRDWSLDELPGLINIVRGEMSVVGPRPFVHVYNELYSPEQARRFEVRPGITGWAQINGRNAISWPEKFALDVWYVDNRSFALDLRIILTTIGRVFKRHGINSEQAATMPRFWGETAMPGDPPAPAAPASAEASVPDRL
jgi:lipopolysaccharide/colanic/teichoic acid biosynthesis glycosyltransferase